MVSLMARPHFKHIYGPVYSWRLGMSLGIDPLTTDKKYCSFNCSYCQLGANRDVCLDRRAFVPVEEVVAEVKALEPHSQIDYLTFSGHGEPTLASNLGEMIRAVKSIRNDKVAVITNSSTVIRPDVQADLKLADLVLFKIDAADQKTFEVLAQPVPGLKLENIVRGIKDFKKTFKGKLALQMMFVAANKSWAPEMASLARDIAPDEVQINTPLRPGNEKPLSEAEMAQIKKCFISAGLSNVRSVYEEEKKECKPFDEHATVKRHGRYKG
ncbi:MAG: radical SAM protein [Candidatus Omnitrophica bacterium]|nr:radical SAM protein [Candidatus Omnitrophota bacterium]